jgi:hypothetical protein
MPDSNNGSCDEPPLASGTIATRPDSLPERVQSICSKTIGTLLRRLKQSGGALPVSEFTADPSCYWPTGFKVSRYTGLIGCELHRLPDGSSRILAFWKDAASRDGSNATLGKELAAKEGAPSLLVSVQNSSKRVSASIGDVVLKAAALIGGLAVVSSLFSSWLAWPDVSLRVDGVQPANGSINTPVTIRTLVLNNSRTVATDVDLSASSSSASFVSIDTQRTTVPGGAQHAATLNVVFPQAGHHIVLIIARARAGWLVPARAQSLQSPIRIWPLISRNPLEVQSDRTTANVAFLRMNMASGSPTVSNITCLATAQDVMPGIRFLGASPSTDGGGRPQASQGGSRRTITLTWQMAIPRPYEWHPVTISLDSVGDQSPSSWNQLAIGIQTDCEVGR